MTPGERHYLRGMVILHGAAKVTSALAKGVAALGAEISHNGGDALMYLEDATSLANAAEEMEARRRRDG